MPYCDKIRKKTLKIGLYLKTKKKIVKSSSIKAKKS